MTEYKTIETNADNVDHEILDAISSKYPENDIHFNLDGATLITYLREIDLVRFKDDIENITQLLGKEKDDAEFLFDVLNCIENIGSYGIKGKKRIYIGFDRERKVRNRKKKVEKRGVHYYANDNEFTRENNELPSEYENRIICADSITELGKLPDNCIDLVFTSPPYNFGLEYSETPDDKYWESYFEKLFGIFGECIRVLKFGGRIAVNVQPLFSDYIPTHHIISNFFMNNKMIWKGEILWEKNNYNCKYTAWGSWKSPSNPYLKYTWEFIELFCKGSMKKPGSKDDADITADEFKKWVVAKWSIAPERNMKTFGHPAMFPEELAARVIKLFSYRNDVVLDPFNGVGTTTAVARNLGRRYIGIDISDEYCDAAEKRIQSTLF